MSTTLNSILVAHRGRARNERARADLTMAEWTATILHFGGKCAYCQDATAEVMEHFMPIAIGGGTTKTNVVPSCKPCNLRKAAKPPSEALNQADYNRIASYLESLVSDDDPLADVDDCAVEFKDMTLAFCRPGGKPQTHVLPFSEIEKTQLSEIKKTLSITANVFPSSVIQAVIDRGICSLLGELGLVEAKQAVDGSATAEEAGPRLAIVSAVGDST